MHAKKGQTKSKKLVGSNKGSRYDQPITALIGIYLCS